MVVSWVGWGVGGGGSVGWGWSGRQVGEVVGFFGDSRRSEYGCSSG